VDVSFHVCFYACLLVCIVCVREYIDKHTHTHTHTHTEIHMGNVECSNGRWTQHFLVFWKKLAKLAGWSPMDLHAKWHFSEYKFDMK